MEPLLIVSLVVGFALCGALGFFIGKVQAKQEIIAALEAERHLESDRLVRMRDSFSAVAADALQKNNASFIALATQTLGRFRDGATADFEKRQKAIEELVRPVKETLSRFETSVQELEKTRVGAYEGLSAQIKSLFESEQGLRSETSNLVNALKTPQVKGRWGEMQLRRVVELAGMVDHCDFLEQETITAEDGRLRPDMIVNLPNNNVIVIDAKSPLDRYLLAMDTHDDAEKQRLLADYARQVRSHISVLSAKGYWDQFSATPDFVLMFLPGESFFSAALQADPSLIEAGVAQRVIVATPTTLIALLKAVAYGWRQEKLATDAENIAKLGKELYERVCKMGEHFASLGAALRNAVERYNDAVGTLEKRVFVSARRFRDMPIAATDKELEQSNQIEAIPRQLQVAEITGRDEAVSASTVHEDIFAAETTSNVSDGEQAASANTVQ